MKQMLNGKEITPTNKPNASDVILNKTNPSTDKDTVEGMLGNISIENIADGTVTGAICEVDERITVNLLKPTLQTCTVNGVTCTNNGDGTYTLNGTATDYTVFQLDGYIYGIEGLKILGCPLGGNVNSYRITCDVFDGEKKWVAGYDDCDKGTFINTIGDSYLIYITVKAGCTCNDLVFKPMITTNLNATYDDFVPYTGDTGNLNGDVAQKVNKSDVLTLEEIQASTDLTGKVASAESVKELTSNKTLLRQFIVLQTPSGTKIKVSGRCHSRAVFAVIFPADQTLQLKPITLFSYGSGGIEDIKGIHVDDPNNLDIVVQDITITIPDFGNSWGYHRIIVFEDTVNVEQIG